MGLLTMHWSTGDFPLYFCQLFGNSIMPLMAFLQCSLTILDFLNSRSSIFTPFHLPTHTTRYYISSLPELIPVLNHTIFTSLSGHNLLFVPYLSHSPVCTKSVPSAHPYNVPCGNSIPSSKVVFISIYLIMSFMHVYL